MRIRARRIRALHDHAMTLTAHALARAHASHSSQADLLDKFRTQHLHLPSLYCLPDYPHAGYATQQARVC